MTAATLAGTLAHEVMHPALHHHLRRSGRDPKRWNIACDYAINPLLVDAGLKLPEGVLLENRFRGLQYLIYGMSCFIAKWERDGWRNRRGCQIQHRQLWTELTLRNAKREVRWVWLKGHNGHRDQTRADSLAYRAARTSWLRERVAA